MKKKIGGSKSKKLFGGDTKKLHKLAKLMAVQLPDNPTDADALAVIMKLAKALEQLDMKKKIGD